VRPSATLAAALLVAGCARSSGPVRAAGTPTAAPARDVGAIAPPPVEAPDVLVDLPVPGHAPAVVAVPRESGAGRPVLVATHGAGGTPEAHCAFWRELIGGAAFVLCPRGVTMDVLLPPAERGYFYPAHPALAREVRAALGALVARFAGRVDVERALYAGFSQGAIMGAIAFSRDPAPFAGAVLIEGGAEEWSVHNARTFRAGGGRRVVFACGHPRCAAAARRSAGYLRREGVESRVVDASGAGHTLDGAVREGVARELPWLLEGDARWRGGE